MEDDNSMSERILRKLETILSNDFELKEFIIIPVETNTKNKSPILYEDHNIALESWCVKHIYRYAYLELFEARKLLSRRKLSYVKEHSLNHLLTGALLINPDVSAFWNMKRELVEDEVLSVHNELIFTKVVLSYKHKSNETFAYRRWLLKRILVKILEDDFQTPQTLLESEMNVCEMAAAKSANNYHAWTHRIWCMENFGHRVANFQNSLSSELEFSQKWVSEHVSEHTGFHYRQYLFDRARKTRNAGNIFEFYYNEVINIFNLVNENDHKNLLTFLLGKDKCKTIEEKNSYLNYCNLLLFDLYKTMEILNSIFPSHETIWYHRRYLLYNLLKTAHEYHGLVFKIGGRIEEVALHGTNIVNVDHSGFSDGEKQPKLFKSQPSKVESSLLYQALIKNESDFVKRHLTRSAISYELELAKRYEKWLRFVICLEDV